MVGNRCMLGLAAASLVIAARAQANLVVNGGFEDGTYSVTVNDSSRDEPNGWTFTRADLGSRNSFVNYGSARSGSCTYEFPNDAFDPGFALDTIAQDIPTTPGQTYTLTFYLTVPRGATGPASFLTTWDGAPITPTQGTVESSGYWANTATVVGGSGATTELTFGGARVQSLWFLDDVSVDAVPEPTALAASLVTGTALLARRRSRGRGAS